MAPAAASNVKTLTLPDGTVIEYVHTSDVVPWLIAGFDAHFVAAARVSTSKDTVATLQRAYQGSGDAGELDTKDAGLLDGLIGDRHSGPFAHGLLSVYVDTSLFVWQQIGTHPELRRSRESARYRTLRPRFYVPGLNRPSLETADFHPMHPTYRYPDAEEWQAVTETLLTSYAAAWQTYQSLRAGGVLKELARMVLPSALMSTGIISASPLHWLRALSIRTQTPDSRRVSHVQFETAEVFMAVDRIMRERWPNTMAAFDASGREAP